MKRAFKFAFPKTIPVMMGYVFLGITYGILSKTSGLPIWFPILTSAAVYTGSLEFVMVSMMASTFNPLNVLVTALMIGARHIFYGLSMLEKYRGMKGKGYLIYTTSDETFAVNYSMEIPADVSKNAVYFLVSILDQSYWILGATLGSIFGSFITFNTTGLDFVMTTMFAAIFMDQWVKDSKGFRELCQLIKNRKEKPNKFFLYIRKHLPALVGVIASVICLLVFGPDNFIVPSMVLILVALLLLRPILDEPTESEVE